MLSIDEIKNISFRKASLGGYKPEDVDAFIDQVLITMEQLRKEKSDLVKKMDILATRVEEYRADEDSVRNALLSAQRVADSTIKEARAKAARIIEESENLAKAKLFDLNVQIKQQKKQYTLLLAECNRVRDEIIKNCNKHIIIANELPSPEKIQVMETSIDEKYPTETSDTKENIRKTAATEDKLESVNLTEPIVEETTSIDDTPLLTGGEDIAVFSPEEVQEKVIHEDDSVNIINDFDDRDNFDVYYPEKREKKKSKVFGVLKFGDDYDFNNDNENE